MWTNGVCTSTVCLLYILMSFEIFQSPGDAAAPILEVPSHRPGQATPSSGKPAIVFENVPPYGSTNMLRGRALETPVRSSYVTVYIYVPHAGWWIKPYFDQPRTTIGPDGSWVCPIVTGGDDIHATILKAYLLPGNVEPPLVGGMSDLPEWLDSVALATTKVHRHASGRTGPLTR